MKLIIDIPEWYYHEVQEFKHPNFVDKAIMDGIILPKRHGRLIDADALDIGTVFDEEGNAVAYRYVTEHDLDNAPTIIEAEEEKQ